MQLARSPFGRELVTAIRLSTLGKSEGLCSRVSLLYANLALADMARTVDVLVESETDRYESFDTAAFSSCWRFLSLVWWSRDRAECDGVDGAGGVFRRGGSGGRGSRRVEICRE